MWIGWMVFFFKCYEMFCITLCYVFVHFAGFVSDNRSKCALIYLCIRDSIVCIDFVGRFGISKCFFLLERAKLCTNRDFSGNIYYSGLVFNKKYLLNKLLSLKAVSCSFTMNQAHLRTPHMHHKVPHHHQPINRFNNLLKTNSIYCWYQAAPSQLTGTVLSMNKHSWMFN